MGQRAGTRHGKDHDEKISSATPSTHALPRGFGWFSLGVKANAEAAVWGSHAANTTTSSDQDTKIPEEEPTRSGRPLFPEGGAVLRAPGIGPCIACWCS